MLWCQVMSGRHMKGCVYSNACPRAGGWSIFIVLINAGCLVFQEDNTRQVLYNAWALSLMCLCPDTIWKMAQTSVSLLQLCVSKLRLFIEDADQNLKYLGLLTMSKIMQSHPRAIHQLKWVMRVCNERCQESEQVALFPCPAQLSVTLQYIKAVDSLEYFITWAM